MQYNAVPLPFAVDSLEPSLSAELISLHYEQHYLKYIANLNRLTTKANGQHLGLEEIMVHSYNRKPAIYQNAAQAWNHEFYWKCLCAKSGSPPKRVSELLKGQFGSLQKFKDDFSDAALNLFGSGWIWVVADRSSQDIKIRALGNAENPLNEGQVPLLVCDVWEHAYYLDYHNDRRDYVSQFWKIVNWKFMEENYLSSISLPKHVIADNKTQVQIEI